VANGELLTELKEYAQREGKALPAALFQGIVMRALAQALDDNVTMKKALENYETRLKTVEERHCDEDQQAEKRGERRWDLNKSLLVGVILLILTNMVGWAVQISK